MCLLALGLEIGFRHFCPPYELQRSRFCIGQSTQDVDETAEFNKPR
jgi:hypothetical protein